MSKAFGEAEPSFKNLEKSGLTTVIGFVQLLALLAVAIDGLFVKVGPMNINSERLMIFPVLVLLTYIAIVTGKLHVTNAMRFYFIWACVALFSTLLSWAPSKHINGLIITVVPFFYFLLFSERGSTFANVGRMIEGWIWLVSLGALASFAIFLLTGRLEFMIDRGRPHFLMFEPNIMGAVLASMMVAHFAFFRPILRHFALHACGLLALLCSASRFPYLAYAVVVLYYFFRTGLIRRPIVFFYTAMAVVSVVVFAGFFSYRIVDAYTSNLDRVDAIDNRMIILSFVWERFLLHPIFGNGPLDFGVSGYAVLAQVGSTDIHDLWIWQVWVSVLHDEGILGLLPFLALLVATWRRTERLINQGHTYYLAYQGAALALVISSQGTTEHLTAAWGIIFGLANSPPFVRRSTRLAAAKKRQALSPGPMVARPRAGARRANEGAPI